MSLSAWLWTGCPPGLRGPVYSQFTQTFDIRSLSRSPGWLQAGQSHVDVRPILLSAAAGDPVYDRPPCLSTKRLQDRLCGPVPFASTGEEHRQAGGTLASLGVTIGIVSMVDPTAINSSAVKASFVMICRSRRMLAKIIMIKALV